MTAAVKKLLLLAGSLILLWLLLRPLMGVALPFLLGGLLALAAEPAVRLLSRKLPRGVAAGIGVSAALVLTLCVLFLLAAIAVRELGRLAAALPDLGQTALQGISALQTYLLELAQKAPEGLRSILHSVVNGLFSGSSAVVDEITRRLPPPFWDRSQAVRCPWVRAFSPHL